MSLQASPVPESIDIASNQTRSEVQEYLLVREERRRLIPRALLVGLAAGVLAVAFRGVLALGDSLRATLFTQAHQFPAFGWVLTILFSAFGAGVSVWLVRRFSPEASGSGIPHLEAVLRRFRTLNGARVLPVKFVGGVLALGSGLALGREGPTVQMGAAVADLLSGKLGANGRERRTLLAAGAGAGLAAAFNAPLSGLVFVLEEVQRDFRPVVFGTAFVAAAAADVLSRTVSGQLPVFQVPAYSVPELTALPAFVVLGVVAGGLGVLFNRSLIGSLNAFSRWVPARFAVMAAVLVGGAIGLIGWFSPAALGSGHHLAEEAMAGKVALWLIPLWILLRFGMTMTSYATGAPGGIFAPLLAIGALIGLGVGDLAHLIAPTAIPQPALFAVVGMAAYFTAVVRAPLTGIVLIVEMTGSYALMLPLLLACFCAYAVAETLNDRPIYEALLERDLARGAAATPHPHSNPQTVVTEFTVEAGSAFAGQQVRDLGLPPGCILVSLRGDNGEQIPDGLTRLESGDRLTAVISSEAVGAAMAQLREGCERRYAGGHQEKSEVR
jgi:CIC family chloride channel protein